VVGFVYFFYFLKFKKKILAGCFRAHQNLNLVICGYGNAGAVSRVTTCEHQPSL
jgi:hypothetical protein